MRNGDLELTELCHRSGALKGRCCHAAARWAVAAATALLMLAPAVTTQAAKIADITHLQGQRENRLTGLGLVVGLSGTGDGGKFLPAIRPLAAYLQHFGDPILALEELKNAKNVALVSVEAVIGPNGAREGDKLDVAVSALGGAKSLKGGRLLTIPLQGPHPSDVTIYALASGPVSIPNPAVPTVGRIKAGAVVERDVVYSYLTDGKFTLVIDDSHASWAVANAIAVTINEAVSVEGAQMQLASAVDPRNVQVRLPQSELASPASFIAWVQRLPLLMPERQARVTVDQDTGTIVIDGQVGISPVCISYKGVTISTKALLEQQDEQGDPKNSDSLDQAVFVPLRLLVETLDALKLSSEDKINIIRELDRSGNLHGEVIERR